MVYIPNIIKYIDISNSTIDTLDTNGIYNGIYKNIQPYDSLKIILQTTQISANNGLKIYFNSTDNDTNAIIYNYNITNPTTENTPFIINLDIINKFYRIKYTNNSTNSADIKLHSFLSLNNNNTIMGLLDNGQNSEIKISNIGHIKTDIPLTSFGEILNASLFPETQISFIYGLNDLNTIKTTTNGGNIYSTDSLAVLTTTNNINSSALLTSVKHLAYRPGQGNMGRFTGIFSSDNVADTIQLIGLGTLENGYFFGYKGNNSNFGILHKNRNSDIEFIEQSLWNIDTMDGSYNNKNPSGMLINPTKGNVFQIKFQYLGFGAIFFSIENSKTGVLDLVHIIRYANNNTQTNVINPVLPLMWYIKNLSSTYITLKTASGSLFLEGIRRLIGPSHSLDTSYIIPSDNGSKIYNFITLKNLNQINGVTNYSSIRIKNISIAASVTGNNSTGIITLQCIINSKIGSTDIGYSPGYQHILENQSITQYYLSSDIVNNGKKIFNTCIADNGNSYFDINDFDLSINYNETLTFGVKLASSNSTRIGISITWIEDI